MNKPQPQLIAIWRIALTFLTLVPAFLFSFFIRIGSVAWVISIAGLGLFYVATYTVYFPCLYKKMSYTITDEKIVFTTGALSARIISMPLSQVQFAAVSQTLLARIFGLAAVIITAPGGQIAIYGLKIDDAKHILGVLQPRKL